MRKITHLVVHCSATKPSVPVDAKMIDRWHRERGFLKIGYHFVIKRDGTVETGRDLTEPGAHVAGHNATTVGICLAGGLNEKTGKSENNFTDEQFKSLVGVLSQLLDLFPEAEVLGHRDFPGVAKDCPCFDVRKWVSTMPALAIKSTNR